MVMSSRLMVKLSLFPFQLAGRSPNGSKPCFYTTTHHGWRPRSNSVFIKTGSKESITPTVKARCTLNQQCPFLAGSGMKGCLGLRYSTTTPAPLLRLDTPAHIRHFSQLPVSSSSIPSSGGAAAVRRISPTSPNWYVTVAKRSQRWSSSASAVPHNIPSRSTSASTEVSSELSTWNIPQRVRQGGGSKSQSSRRRGPLPLPVQIKATRSQSNRTSSVVKSSSSSSISHPPVTGSQPLFYLAKRFPLLAEQELNAMPHKTAFDYSCFILGATYTSYPSATTLRAVLRQFRNFLKDSLRRQGKTTPIELPKARVWAQVIRGLIRLKQYRRARVAIHSMQRLGIQPTGYTWRSMCRGWIKQGELDRAEALAIKVFTDPSYSHDSQQEEEQPTFFTSKHRPGRSSTIPSSITDFEAKRKHWSPMASHSAPLFLIIQVLAECGEMERARYWYDRIPEHEMTDMITSNMVAGYLKIKQRDKAQEVIRIMAGCGVKPTAIVFNPIVEHAAQNVSMEAAEDLVNDMIGIGLFLNLFTFKILIRGYIAAGQRSKALQCLDRIRASGLETDQALGRILLDALWGVGEARHGDHGPQFQDEQNLGVEDLDFVGKPGWSQRCIEWIRSNHYEQAEEAIRQSLDLSNTSDVEIVQVIKALADHQALPRARYWLDHLMSFDEVRYDNSVLVDLMNHVVARYIKVQQPKEAEAVIRVMSQRGVLPTVETANLIVQGSILNGEMVDAEAFVQRMVESGISINQQTYETLCQGYALRGAIESLQECFTKMEEAGFGPSTWSPATGQLQSYLLGSQGADSEQWQSSSSSSFNVLDTLCTQWIEQGHITRADRFVRQLLTNPNVPADKIPFASLIQGWIHQSQQNPVSALATPTATRSSKSSRSNPSQPTSSSVSSSKSLDQETRMQQESVAKMSRARSWFDKIPEGERTLELANWMIGGYMGLGLEGEADELIQWLALRKIKPDVVTYNHILRHTVQRLSMPAAEGLVGRMQKGGLSPNIDTWNLLIRGYVIRGELREALQCLDRMAGRIPVTSEASKPRSRKSRTRAEIEIYDREIVDAVVQDEDEEYGADGVVVAERMKESFGSVAPNETTVQLILSGFGAEPRIQGQGDSSDYTRALEVYRTRVERQTQQQELLFEGLATLRQHPQTLGTRVSLSSSSPSPFSPLSSMEREESVDEKKKKEEKEEEQEAWILDHVGTLQRVGALSDSDIGMTDVDWKIELKWEEMIEMERERERKLSGPRLDSLK